MKKVKAKIVCGQMPVIAGRPDLNYKKITEIIAAAREQGADILCLPEMCVSGYLIGDIWEQQDFLDDVAYYNNEIIKASDDMAILFGTVCYEAGKLNEDGRVRMYNAAYAAQHGKTVGGYLGRNYIIKNSQPNYREFDDARHFYSLQKLCAEEFQPVPEALTPIQLTINGEKLSIGLMLCEDGWTENYFYNVPQILAKNNADILVNLSCSPYALGKNKKRNRLFGAQAREAGIPLVYCNCVGIQNNGKNVFTMDGCTSVYQTNGELATAAEMYADTLLPFTYEDEEIIPECPVHFPAQNTEAIYKSLHYGTKLFLEQCGIKRMTIGLSGGIDSAVTAAMYVDILGPENVLLINMPSQFNSEATKSLAQDMAKKLGTNYAIIPIQQSFEHTVEQLEATPIINYGTGNEIHLELTELVKENIQARDRGARILAAASAAFGGAFSCNSNKSEITVGYATFYGDICGAVAMIGDLWKHQVYDLGRYLNEVIFKREVIPEDIFTIRPSAELNPNQTVGKGGDPLIYPYHDYLFSAFVESWHKATPADVLRWYKEGTLAKKIGCDEQIIKDSFPTHESFINDLERWWKLYAGFSVAKRIQAPPIISMTKRSYGYDHREAQLSPYFSREYYKLKEEMLN